MICIDFHLSIGSLCEDADKEASRRQSGASNKAATSKPLTRETKTPEASDADDEGYSKSHIFPIFLSFCDIS